MSNYLAPFMTGKAISAIVTRCENYFLPQAPEFDTIAVRGNSGLLIGSVLAYKWDKQLIIVRKEERSHSSQMVEGWGKNQKILIVDDFKESGNTIDQIYEWAGQKCDNPTFVGVLLYAATYKTMKKETHTHADGTVFPVWKMFRMDGGK